MPDVRIIPARLIMLAAALVTIVPPAQAAWPWGRQGGLGWGDGYHAACSPPPHFRKAHCGSSAPSWAEPLPDSLPEAHSLPHGWPDARHAPPAAARLRGSSLLRQPGEGSSVLISGHAAAGM
jgi:hypothetical protein